MKKTDIHLALDRMCESWLQNFSDLKSGRITISESRRRSKELDKDMKVIKKAIREEKRSDDPITKAVIHLGKLCGMDNSDSGSEAFVEQLHLCTGRTMGDIDESHAEEGLCLDACRVLADRLKKKEKAANCVQFQCGGHVPRADTAQGEEPAFCRQHVVKGQTLARASIDGRADQRSLDTRESRGIDNRRPGVDRDRPLKEES